MERVMGDVRLKSRWLTIEISLEDARYWGNNQKGLVLNGNPIDDAVEINRRRTREGLPKFTIVPGRGVKREPLPKPSMGGFNPEEPPKPKEEEDTEDTARLLEVARRAWEKHPDNGSNRHRFMWDAMPPSPWVSLVMRYRGILLKAVINDLLSEAAPERGIVTAGALYRRAYRQRKLQAMNDANRAAE